MKDYKQESKLKWLKYAGMGMQFAGMLAFGVWIGWLIDGYFEMDKPVFTLILGLLVIILLLTKLIKDN